MVLTESKKHDGTMVAPNFSLLEPLTGKKLSLADIRGDHGTLIMFICNHCPYVVHLEKGLKACGSKASSMGIGMAGISANDATRYPQDAPDKMKNMAQSTWSTFHYLYDESQETARSYGAVCTPDIFLFDKDDKLYYHKSVTGESLYDAMDALVRGDPPITNAKSSIGCSIKWK